MNDKTEQRIKLEAALDRLDAALRRIAAAPRHAELSAPAPAADPAAGPRTEDLAARLDHLIIDLRRALAGESN